MTMIHPSMLHNPLRRRGVALLMVLVVIGICTVLSLAMMSSSTVQAMVGDNLARASRADVLAESGVNYAMLQLKRTAASDNCFTGTTLSLGDDVPGRCTIVVQRIEKSLAAKRAEYPEGDADALANVQEYRIQADVEMTDASGAVQARGRSTARVLAWSELPIRQAGLVGGNLSLTAASPSAVVFDSIAVNGNLTLLNLNTVRWPGMAYANIINATTIPGSRQGPFAAAEAWITKPVNVRTFETYVYRDGKTYSAATLPTAGGVLSNFNSIAGSASNPANVYRHVGSLTLNGNVRIKGTLVVENGDLIINGTSGFLDLLGLGANNLVDASADHSAGFPAIVVKGGSIQYAAAPSGRLLIARGVTWVSGQIGSLAHGTGTEMIFDGSVVLPSPATSIYTRGQVTMSHRSDCTKVPLLDQSLPSRIHILEWTSGR